MSRKISNMISRLNFLINSFSYEGDDEQIDTSLLEIENLLLQLHKGADNDPSVKEAFVNLSSSFSKIKDRANEKRMRKKLLQGFSTSHDNDVTIEMQQLLDENRSLQNSIEAGNEFINHVNATNEEIAQFNAAVSRTDRKVVASNNLFGVASSLLSSINKQKKKHAFVIATITGLCICFILWYWFSR